MGKSDISSPGAVMAELAEHFLDDDVFEEGAEEVKKSGDLPDPEPGADPEPESGADPDPDPEAEAPPALQQFTRSLSAINSLVLGVR